MHNTVSIAIYYKDKMYFKMIKNKGNSKNYNSEEVEIFYVQWEF